MTLPKSPALNMLTSPCQRILLVNAPAADVRLPWARWRQPTGLLRIGSTLRAQGCDVRLIDCLQVPTTGRLTRERFERLDIEGRSLDLWRFGLSLGKVAAQLQSWAREGWRPERIFISCGLSTWWQGARDLIACLKTKGGTAAPIALGGAYPTFYPEHAAKHTLADEIVGGDLPNALTATPDLTLYLPGRLPRFAGIYLCSPGGLMNDTSQQRARPAAEIAEEVTDKAKLGVTTFAFFDPWLGPDHHDALAATLEAIARKALRNVGFVVVGNLSPRTIDDELAQLLRQVRFRQVYLHDDVQHLPDGLRHLTTEDHYTSCVRALHRAGFRPRTDEVGASVLVGIPGEDLRVVAARLVRLASIVGSVNLVPYQYTPDTSEGQVYARWIPQWDGNVDPARLNAQLYPLARFAGKTLEDYLELTRLAVLLNNKYHSRTFDYLDDSLTCRLMCNSLRNELWNPFANGTKQESTVVVQSVRGLRS